MHNLENQRKKYNQGTNETCCLFQNERNEAMGLKYDTCI